MRETRGALCLCALLTCFSESARADDAAYGASVRVHRPVAARNPEDATAAATTIELADRPLALETLRDVVPEIPGAIALASGGHGAFSSVSLRGADLAQTVWVLGDVPLNGPDGGAFDMSLLPMSQLARIEVYRSGAPVWLGQGSIGGVIRVVPKEAEGTGARAQLGAGSFGLYEARASSYVTRTGGRYPVSLFSGVQVTSARNDFRYVDDGTATLGGNRGADDVERRLRNAELLDASGLLHARLGVWGGHVDVVALGVGRVGGVPGTGGFSGNARFAQREQRRGLTSLAYTREGRGPHGRRYRVQALLSGQGEQRELDDPFGELNLGGARSLEQNMARLFGRVAATFGLTRMLEATLTTNYTYDSFRDSDAYRQLTAGPGTRHTEALAGELRLFGRVLGMRSELRGSVRSEHTQSELSVLRVTTRRVEEHVLNHQTYRLSGLLEPVRGLSLRASLGTGSRVPSTQELFGDGAVYVGNPSLAPEHGRYADAGLVWSRALFDSLCMLVEAQGFWSNVDDKIVLTSRDAFHTVARNVGSATVVGGELGTELSYREHLRLVGAATLMQSETETGNQLPRQPKLRAYGRLEGNIHADTALERVTLFVTLSHLSTAYYDAANLALRAPLTHVGFGAALGFLQDRLELQARVADVFDTRGQDYQRLPLSGRFVGVLLSVKERSHE